MLFGCHRDGPPELMGLLWKVQYTFAKCSVSLVTSLLFPMPSSKWVWNQSPSALHELRARGPWERGSQKNGTCCRFCRATKIDAGNIREQHCLQCNPARLFWKLAYVFIAYIPRKAANQCRYEQNKQGGALTSQSSAGRDWDFSSHSIRTCSIDLPVPLWFALLPCSFCLELIQG